MRLRSKFSASWSPRARYASAWASCSGAHISSTIPAASAAARAGNIAIAGAKFFPHGGNEANALAREVRYAASVGLDCSFHATEVEELDAALAAIENTLKALGADQAERVQFRIEHGGLIPPNYLGPIRDTKTWVVSNPGFIYYRGAKYAGDPGLIPYLYRLKSLREEGIRLAAGSDAPVTLAKPLVAISAAMIEHHSRATFSTPTKRSTCSRHLRYSPPPRRASQVCTRALSSPEGWLIWSSSPRIRWRYADRSDEHSGGHYARGRAYSL